MNIKYEYLVTFISNFVPKNIIKKSNLYYSIKNLKR